MTGNRLAITSPTHWQVTASEAAEGHGPEKAVDANPNTWWRSGASDPQWIQVDLGRPAMVCGVSLQWGEPHATAYAVQTSQDGLHWALGFETAAGDGSWDPVLFDPILARYVRLRVNRGLQASGAALRFLEIKGLADRPEVWVDGEVSPEALALLDGQPSTTWRTRNTDAVMELDLRRPWPVGRVRVEWGPAGYASNLVVELSSNRVDWVTAGRIQARTEDFGLLLAEKILPAQFVRLSFSGASSPEGFEVAEVKLRCAEGQARPWAMYDLAAAQAPEGIYPDMFRRRQTYWAVGASPEPGRAECLLDEWGVFAPSAQGPTVAPWVWTDGELASARQAAAIEHRLAAPGAPMPETVWRLPSGLALRIRAMARAGDGLPMSWVNYELSNESIMTQTGRLVWAIRPLRLPPPWAGGGLAPIYRIRNNNGGPGWQEAWLNGQRGLAVPDSTLSFGATAFRDGDVAEFFRRGETPPPRPVRDDEGLASAAWWTDFHLEPGDRIRMVLAAVDPEQGGGGRRPPWPEAGGGPEAVADAFDREWLEAAWAWRGETDRYAPRIDRPDAIEGLQAQVGWLLGMRQLANGGEGEDLETIAFRVAALYRVGQATAARKWIERVAAGIATDGWVPARFRTEGAPEPRSGQEGRHGSQGQFAFLVMEDYRFTQDTTFLNAQYPAMRSAMAYLQQRRAELEKTEWRLPADERELLEGLLPRSGERPGHPRPGRFYADHYWALLGWKEVRAAASILGRDPDATWAHEQYRALKTAVRRSLRTHLDRRDTSWLPAVAEEDRFDAATVALLFWPCAETDLVEPHELQSSLDYFYEEFLERGQEGRPSRTPTDEFLLLTPLAQMGRGDYAREVLQALLDRRQPRGWQAWANVALGDPRKPGLIGFMPDLRAAAAYVLGVRGLAARETDRRLDLFSGAPPEWLQYGQGFRVFGMPTAFGPLDLHGFWQRDRMAVEIGGQARPPEGYRLWWPRPIAPVRVTARGQPLNTFDALGVNLPHDFQGTVEAVFPYRAPRPREPLRRKNLD